MTEMKISGEQPKNNCQLPCVHELRDIYEFHILNSG